MIQELRLMDKGEDYALCTLAFWSAFGLEDGANLEEIMGMISDARLVLLVEGRERNSLIGVLARLETQKRAKSILYYKLHENGKYRIDIEVQLDKPLQHVSVWLGEGQKDRREDG